MKTGTQLIAEERERQVSQEGYDAKHDDRHTDHALAINAASLTVSGTDCALDDWRPDGRHDWGLDEKHKGDRVRQLSVAGALIAAEIDRLQRQQPIPPATAGGEG